MKKVVKRIYRVSTYFSHSFPYSLHLHYCSSFVITKKWILVHYWTTYSLDFIGFSNNVIFPSRRPITFSHHISLVSFLLALTVSQLSLFLMTLTLRRSVGQVFCIFFLNLNFSNVFLIIRLKLLVFEGRSHNKVPFLGDIISKTYTIDMTYHC